MSASLQMHHLAAMMLANLMLSLIFKKFDLPEICQLMCNRTHASLSPTPMLKQVQLASVPGRPSVNAVFHPCPAWARPKHWHFVLILSEHVTVILKILGSKMNVVMLLNTGAWGIQQVHHLLWEHPEDSAGLWSSRKEKARRSLSLQTRGSSWGTAQVKKECSYKVLLA